MAFCTSECQLKYLLIFQKSYSTDPTTGVQLYKDPADGMVYEWDKEKNAWFPRIDEDFMAVYQMNYGFTADGKLRRNANFTDQNDICRTKF